MGEELTVTGYVRIMESWPDRVIGPPEVGFLSLAMPGPVFAIKDRRLSGEFTPQSVRIARGATYPFSVTAVAREQGRWHVHPSFAVEGTGTLVGAGQWITVGPGVFTNTVALADGSSVDLTTVGMRPGGAVARARSAGGIAWMAYWMRRPLLARAAVVARGEGRRLIGPGDRRVAVGVRGAGVRADRRRGAGDQRHAPRAADPAAGLARRARADGGGAGHGGRVGHDGALALGVGPAGDRGVGGQLRVGRRCG